MPRLRFGLLVPMLLAVVVAAGGTAAFAQGGATSTLAGTVLDGSGAVVPGATITVKDDATGAIFTAFSGANGSFTLPAMPPGTYRVTVELQGFKTAVLNGVTLNVAMTSTVKAVLELGEISETIIVQAATEIVQTQATAVAATMTARQIANLPVTGRAAFDLISFIPGVVTNTGSLRDGTINGLPQSSVNITLDGMNIQDNYAKSWDGMFTRVNPRIDAVEEVTVSTAASSADMGGQGAAQIRYVTRSGSNRYQGSAYFYYRRTWMNTNTWWNLNRNVSTDGTPTPTARTFYDYPGARFGGPIIKDKAFFFVNYEEVRSPGTRTDTRTIMSPTSEQGLFQYSRGTIDLLALAARFGHTSTIDPVIGKLLADVRSSTAQGSVTSTIDPLTQSFTFQQPTESTTKYPTVRLDYQMTSKHRLSFSTTQNWLLSDPDTTNTRQVRYPGFPFRGLQDSDRYTYQISARSVLTKNMVNEFRFGGTGGATKFSPDTTPEMFNGVDGFADQKGFLIDWDAFKGIYNPAGGTAYSAREGSTKVIEDNLSWLKGTHSITAGTSITRGDVWYQQQTLVPTLTLGMATGDPADAMFTSANFPGATSTDLTNARNLYAVLTGRVTSIGRNARVDADGQFYQILGESMQLGRMWQMGFFFQDSWRWRPDLTVNAGLRYEVQLPFESLNNSYSTATIEDLFGRTGTGSNLVVGSTVSNTGNLFKPGVAEGTPTTYKMWTKGTPAFNTDTNNLAPSIGVAWTTGSEGDGLLRRIFGAKGDTVLRGGMNIAYQRGGMSDLTETYGNNPGISIDATRNLTNGNLGTLPVLFRSSDLGAPAIPLERVYPMAVPSASSSVYTFDPNLKLPWALTGTFGIQRALTKDMSVEARYVHTDSHDSWTLGNLAGRLNYNEVMVVENGFLDEFRIAQANLQANVAAGRGSNFRYYGPGTGTSPLPIFLANLNGLSGAAVNDPTKYSGSGWTNSTLVQAMYPYNPNPQTAASNLRSNATYKANLEKAGYPFNFWVVNPDVTNAYVVTNGPETSYNGVQLMMRRRFSKGLQFEANYTYGKGYQMQFYSFRKPYVQQEQNADNGSASLGNTRHSLAVNWVYEAPFGQGRRFLSDAGPILNRIIGDWSFMGVARVSSGRLEDFGNVRLVGMTKDEFKKALKLRKTTDPNNQFRTLVWVLPQDIIDNTIKAFSVTASGYANGEPTGRYLAPANSPGCLESVSGFGDCGVNNLIIQGPVVVRFDMTFSKRITVVGRVNFEFQAQIYNVFNRVNFNTNSYAGSVFDSYQVTGSRDSSRTGQLSFRINF